MVSREVRPAPLRGPILSGRAPLPSSHRLLGGMTICPLVTVVSLLGAPAILAMTGRRLLR